MQHVTDEINDTVDEDMQNVLVKNCDVRKSTPPPPQQTLLLAH